MSEGKNESGHHHLMPYLRENHGHIRIGDDIFISKSVIKYLEVVVDEMLSSGQHMEYICHKASTAKIALA